MLSQFHKSSAPVSQWLKRGDNGSFLEKTLEIHPNDIQSLGNGKLLQPQRVRVVVDLDGKGCSLFSLFFRVDTKTTYFGVGPCI